MLYAWKVYFERIKCWPFLISEGKMTRKTGGGDITFAAGGIKRHAVIFNSSKTGFDLFDYFLVN